MILVRDAIRAYTRYQEMNCRPNTIRSFNFTLSKFNNEFSDRGINSFSNNEVFDFLERITETSKKPASKSSRAGHLSALCNFKA